MRPVLLLATLLLLPALAQAVEAPGFDASAAGTASFTVTDAWTGETRCDAQAAFALEANWYAGAVAWDAPRCGEEGAAPFTFWCSDACFPACDFVGWPTIEEVRCSGALVHDGSWTELTLRRDGAFTFVRASPETTIEARGTLVVASWPSS